MNCYCANKDNGSLACNVCKRYQRNNNIDDIDANKTRYYEIIRNPDKVKMEYDSNGVIVIDRV
jgi:hypothetical protein